MQSKTEEVPVVVNADNMDDETFLMHFEARHNDQLPGLDGFTELTKRSPAMIESYRVFHDTLHRLYILEEQHDHEA